MEGVSSSQKMNGESSTKQQHLEALCADTAKHHVCNVCHKTFSREANLKAHIHTHREEKPHICGVCAKAFNLQVDLDKHVCVPKREDKPHVCDVCQRTFSQRGHLKRHLIVHWREKDCVCSVCQKSFTRQSSLKTKNRSQMGDKPFVCDVCQKASFQQCEPKVPEEQVYLFKVNLKLGGRKQVYREMALKGASSLFQFAETIVNAFNFKLDHLFGFYSNLKKAYDSHEAYSVVYDTKVIPPEPNEKSVKNSYIHQVFQLGRKMLFLFDYGEDWEFIVECRAIVEAKAGETYPQVTKKHGKAPPQYPDCDDDYQKASPQQFEPRAPEERVYLFKVDLKLGGRKKVYREMALKGSSSLSQFAETIVNAFNFELDHAYGFYSSLILGFDSREAYTLFYDTDTLVPDPNEKSVENSYIHKVFYWGRKMLFQFDYGADWEFIVECYAITDARAGETYPQVIKKHGEAPPQYPDYDDE